ncbi:hypothetical protein H4S04_000645 [Coemansia sp. S16]|nr:hypothetical protein H4S04_000645 [Coemansia sp. S16]
MSLPLLSDLHTSMPSLGPIPDGVTLDMLSEHALDPDCNVAAIKLPTAVYRDHITSTRMKCAGSNGDKPVYASGAADLNRQIIPLVVNTQGWLKGLGLDLHYSPCESVKPTNQVQLYDSGSIPERSDEAREWSVGNGLVPTINLSGIKASDPRLVWISAMSYVRVKQMLNY